MGYHQPKPAGLVSGHEFTHAATRPPIFENKVRGEAPLKPAPAGSE
jgi:hypothetical protein